MIMDIQLVAMRNINMDNNFPHEELFLAVKEETKEGWENAFDLIDSKALTFTHFTQNECASASAKSKNILQYACEIADKILATNTVKRIFKTIRGYEYTKEELDRFVNNMDEEGQTALHIAILNKYEEAVEDLILNLADVNMIENAEQVDALRLIYNAGNLHKVMLRLFDRGMPSIEKYECDTPEELNWLPPCDFSFITGCKSIEDKDNDKHHVETRLLATVLTQEKHKRKEILLHPLVQLFLHIKGQRFEWAIWISVFYHILRLLVTVTFIADHMNWLNIIYSNNDSSNAESDFKFKYSKSYSIHSHYPPSHLIYDKTAGFLFSPISFSILGFYLTTLFIAVYEWDSCPDKGFYIRKYETIGLVVNIVMLLIATLFSLLGHFNETSIVWIYYVVMTAYFIAMVTSLLLIQGRMTKVRYLGVQNEMLMKTLKRFACVFCAFLPTLLAFILVFRSLLPEREEFNANWGFGWPKILSMMVGELTYDEIFHNKETFVPHPVTTKLVFLVFVLFVVILLQNLLIGLTVDVVEKLKEECFTNHLAIRLETMYLLECFFFSSPITKLLVFLNKKDILNGLLVIPVSPEEAEVEQNEQSRLHEPESPPDKKCIKLTDLPQQLQKAIKQYKFSSQK